MSDRRSVEEMIRLGADLAEAKRQFPDAVPYLTPGPGAEYWPETELMSKRLTVADVNCIARGHGDYVRLGKRIGTVVVFETGLRVGKTYSEYATGTISGLLDRIATHPIGREVAIAALDEKTWAEFCEKYPVSGSMSDAFREIRDKFTAHFGQSKLRRLPDAKLTAAAALLDFNRWTIEAEGSGVQYRDHYYYFPADGAETWEITRADMESCWGLGSGRYEIHVVDRNDSPIVPPWVAYEGDTTTAPDPARDGSGGREPRFAVGITLPEGETGGAPSAEPPPWADTKERVADAIGRVFLSPRVLRWLVESRILTWEEARGAFWTYREKNLPESWEDWLAMWEDCCAAWDEANGVAAPTPAPPIPSAEAREVADGDRRASGDPRARTGRPSVSPPEADAKSEQLRQYIALREKEDRSALQSAFTDGLRAASEHMTGQLEFPSAQRPWAYGQYSWWQYWNVAEGSEPTKPTKPHWPGVAGGPLSWAPPSDVSIFSVAPSSPVETDGNWEMAPEGEQRPGTTIFRRPLRPRDDRTEKRILQTFFSADVAGAEEPPVPDGFVATQWVGHPDQRGIWRYLTRKSESKRREEAIETIRANGGLSPAEAHILRNACLVPTGIHDATAEEKGEWPSALRSLTRLGLLTAYRPTPLGEAVNALVGDSIPIRHPRRE